MFLKWSTWKLVQCWYWQVKQTIGNQISPHPDSYNTHDKMVEETVAISYNSSTLTSLQLVLSLKMILFGSDDDDSGPQRLEFNRDGDTVWNCENPWRARPPSSWLDLTFTFEWRCVPESWDLFLPLFCLPSLWGWANNSVRERRDPLLLIGAYKWLL